MILACTIIEKPAQVADQAIRIDRTVAEIFATMLHRNCSSVAESPAPAQELPSIAAMIVFSGSVDGHCIVQVPLPAAKRLTSALLGDAGCSSGEGSWDDAMLNDAVGELCNMVAGGWKASLAGVDAQCQMSVPTVARVAQLSAPVHGEIPHKLPSNGLTTLQRLYAFDNSVIEVALSIR